MSGRVQVFELQPSYASDVAGAAATLAGNLADVHEALAGAAQRALKAPDATLETGLTGEAVLRLVGFTNRVGLMEVHWDSQQALAKGTDFAPSCGSNL